MKVSLRTDKFMYIIYFIDSINETPLFKEFINEILLIINNINEPLEVFRNNDKIGFYSNKKVNIEFIVSRIIEELKANHVLINIDSVRIETKIIICKVKYITNTVDIIIKRLNYMHISKNGRVSFRREQVLSRIIDRSFVNFIKDIYNSKNPRTLYKALELIY